MADHDPLTLEHTGLLDQMEQAPILMSQNDRLFTPRGQALGFLIAAGYAIDRVEHVSHEAGKSTVSISRTDKARP